MIHAGRKILPLFAVGLLAVLLLTYQLNKPFVGHHDFNNVFYGNMARNLLRYPLLETKLGQITNSGWVSVSDFTYHTHHPPLLVWLLAVSYKLFGVSEVSTRLVPVAFSALTVILFYLLTRTLFNKRIALAASIFWLVTPLFLYFGKMAVQEILVLFFFVAAYLAYQKKRYFLMTGAVLGGVLSGWPGYYISAAIITADILRVRKLRKEMAGLLAVPLLSFFLFLLHNHLLTGSFLGGGLAAVFSLRSSGVPIAEYLWKEMPWVLAYFSRPLAAIAVLGFGLAVVRKQATSFLPFLVFGTLHLVFFREAAFRHDYLIYYLLPFITLSAAWLLERTPVVIIAAAVFFWSSWPFSQALLASDYARDGYTVGRLINKTTGARETVLIIDDKIYNNFDWQVVFYGDRKMTILPQQTAKTASDWIVKREVGGSFEITKTGL